MNTVLEESESGISTSITNELDQLETKNERVDHLNRIKEETRNKMSQVPICRHFREFAARLY